MKASGFMFILFLFSAIHADGQEYLFPLNHELNRSISSWIAADTSGFHSSVQPYTYYELKQIMPLDSVLNVNRPQSKFSNTWVGRKLFKEHLIQVNADDLLLSVDPVFNLQIGRETNNSRNTFVSTRGALVQGNYRDKFYFYTGFHENQARYPLYIDSTIRIYHVAPGQGVVKVLPNEEFDFSQATGGIGYTLNKHFDFLLANDKNFIGDGYRSLLLSDNSYSYPFLRINMTFWKFRYTVIYAVMQDLKSPYDPDVGFRKKYATFHNLDLNIGKKNNLTVGIFEAVIFKSHESRGYEVSYLNPMLFLRPVENSNGSPDNELLGSNIRWKINRHHVLYGQLMLDEFLIDEVRAGNGWWGNKQAFQLGYKSLDIFNVHQLHFQTEFNFCRPFTYSHRSTLQNYANHQQALADPLGTDFTESISFLSYRYKNWFAQVEVQYASMGRDTGLSNLGNDIFKDYLTRTNGDYGYRMYGGMKTTLSDVSGKIQYLLNPKTNFVIELGLQMREMKNSVSDQKTTFVTFGIRTALENYYFDY